MKKLSIEEKAKAYDEALKKSKRLYEQGTITESLAYIFPELKESEDEKIRKGLIKSFENHHSCNFPIVDGFTREQILAWLEKQGEQKYVPKFKIGNWIINNDKRIAVPTQVLEIEKYGYATSRGYISFDKVKTDYHLWTIQDADDGDVLVGPLPKTRDNGEPIFIFNRINSRDYVDNCIEYYCCVCGGVFYENKNGDQYMGTTSSLLHPATKEQRDLLFSKMKEAGYEWDAEKKELKKIEQKSADKVKPKFKVGDIIKYVGEREEFSKENYIIKKILDDCYLTIDDTYIPFKFEEYYIPIIQNQSWSEEDEKILNQIQDHLREYHVDKKGYPYVAAPNSPEMMEYNWLKSLKERMKGGLNYDK